MPINNTLVGPTGEGFKGILVQNIFTKGSQALQIVGFDALIPVLSRDAITLEMGVIELADKTKIPGGRTNAGEFTATIQLGNNAVRNQMEDWYRASINNTSRSSTNFKKNGKIIYYRHNNSASGVFGSGADDHVVELKGMFLSKLEYPEFDMSGGDEGDAEATLNITINYDWAGKPTAGLGLGL